MVVDRKGNTMTNTTNTPNRSKLANFLRDLGTFLVDLLTWW